MSAKTRHLEVGHQIQLAKGSAGPISCLHTGPWHKHETCRFSSDSASGDIHLEQKQLSSSFVPPTGPQSLPRIFFSARTAWGGKTLSVPPYSGGSSSHRASRNIAARAAVTCAEGQPLPLSVVSHTHPHGFHPGKHSLLPLWLPRRGGSALFAEKAQLCQSPLLAAQV